MLKLAVLVIALALVIGETAPRLVALPEKFQEGVYARDTLNTGLYQLDDAAGYVMVPNYHGRLHSADFDQSFDTNSRGLRDGEVSPKQPGEFRVVVLGDSFVMGAEVPVEQRFTDRLEALLHDRGYQSVHVVNVGVRGWGTYNEAGFLQENIGWLQPDLVVLSLFVGNIGVNVFATAAGYQLNGGGIAYGPPGQVLEGDSVTWFDHNFLVGAAEYQQPTLAANAWSPADGLPSPLGNTQPTSPAGAQRQSSYVPNSAVDAARTWVRNQSVLYRDLSDGWFRLRHGYARPDPLMLDNWLVYTLREGPHQYWYDLALPLTAHYVDQARAAAAQAGAPLVTVLIPHDAQVDATRLRQQLDQYHLSQDEIVLDKPQQELSAAVGGSGIAFLDLAPILRATQDVSGVFFAHDIHFTAWGHGVVARALADWLAPMINTAQPD